jgi:hypothetical protein
VAGDQRDKPRRRFWSDSDRARVGQRARTAPPEPVLDRDSDGTPAAAADEENTNPIELLCAAPTPDVRELAEQLAAALHRDRTSPATIEQLAALYLHDRKVRERTRDAAHHAADAAAELAAAKVPAVERLAALERDAKFAKKVIAAALTLALGSAGATVKNLYARGVDEGAYRTRIEHLERDSEQLRLELRDLRRYRGSTRYVAPEDKATATRTP